ncbi:hypothetical protein DITRI_Ditri03aG0094100 [Diplodiscus trichospermus]
MQSFIGGSIRLGKRQGFYSWSSAHFKATTRAHLAAHNNCSIAHGSNNSINSSTNNLVQYVGILDKEAVEEVKGQREIPDIQPGNIVQLKVG